MVDEKKSDLPAALARGTLGAIPIVGPLVAEVVGNFLPNRRLERIEGLLLRLSDKVRDLDEQRLREKFEEPEFVDLFEDGVFQATRALSDERVEYIASLLESGITSDREKFLENKTLLQLLGELNDVEVILLRSYARNPQDDEEFRTKHADTLAPKRAYIGAPREELDEYTMRGSYLTHMTRLGLLRPHIFPRPKKGELPEFDYQTGMIKSSSHEITPLGRLLLARIELIREDERP